LVRSVPGSLRETARGREERAQTAIRALIARGRLSPEQRLELAAWQREWAYALLAVSRRLCALPSSSSVAHPVSRPNQTAGGRRE
jgi:hypothetical protein